MSNRIRDQWTTPFMEKWGRLGLLAMTVVMAFVFFVLTDTSDTTDNYISLGIATALWLGIVASVITTEKYISRSLGLLAAISGSCIYFYYLYLQRSGHHPQRWMLDWIRACFVIGAPLFGIATIVALIQWMRERRNQRRAEA